MKGKIKWFNSEKGYGFVTDETGEDLFVHFSQIQMDGYKTLEQDQEVTFDIVENEKGKSATNVKPV